MIQILPEVYKVIKEDIGPMYKLLFVNSVGVCSRNRLYFAMWHRVDRIISHHSQKRSSFKCIKVIYIDW